MWVISIQRILERKKSLEPDMVMLIGTLHYTVKTEQLTQYQQILHVMVKVCHC